MTAIGLFGGAFDPPHNGHVALAETATRVFGLEPLVVIVAEAPWHKRVLAPAEARLELARAAFPAAQVELDPHPSTVELLEELLLPSTVRQFLERIAVGAYQVEEAEEIEQ